MIKIIRSNKVAFYALIFIWFLAGSVIFNHTIVNAQTQSSQPDNQRYLRLFTEVLMRIRQTYVDELAIDELITSAIDGMLSEMDPHTTFFRPDDFREFTTSTMGEFGGLGITIDRRGDFITVVSPMEGTPAYRMGIQAGDRIIRADDNDMIGITTDEALRLMRGTPGTRVVIGIDRPGVEGVLEFDIIREIIRISSIPHAFKLDNGIGYIRIRQFNAQTTMDLRRALDRLEQEGIRGLLIDLRFNPGGLLNEAVDTVNEFIGPNRLVVSTRGRMRESNRQYNTRFNRMRTGYPVMALINEASASAAEIFAGSLQDWDKGLVVGKTSFGKGSVQQLYPLSDGYGLKVTISRYYINSGRGIHREENDRILRGERVTQEERDEIARQNEQHRYYTVNGRVVFGGGGVVPDIEIEQDVMTRLDREIRRMNLFFDFSVDYFAKYGDSITLDFKPSDAMVGDFLEFARSKGLTYEQAELDSSMNFIMVSLTRDIIGKKFGETEAYKAAIPLDSQLTEALRLFDRFPTLEQMFEYVEQRRQNGEQGQENGEQGTGNRRGRRG